MIWAKTREGHSSIIIRQEYCDNDDDDDDDMALTIDQRPIRLDRLDSKSSTELVDFLRLCVLV